MKVDLYTRMYLWLVSHRWAVLIGTILFSIACLLLSLRIDLEEDILAILPQNDPMVDDYRYTLRKFRQIDRVFFDVGLTATNAEPEVLGRAADQLYDGLSTNRSLSRILYRFELGGQKRAVDLLTGSLPNLFTAEDATALAGKLEPAEIRSYLTVMRRKLAGPEGMVLKDVVPADPIAMSALVLRKVLPLQTGFGDTRLEDGRIVSHDGRHALIMAEPSFPSSNSGQSTALVADLLGLAATVERAFPGVHVAITGGHRMSVDNATLIKGDATRCILLGMGVMLVLCLAAYRRRWLALVTFLPSFVGTLVSGVVLALGQKHLSAIATGFGAIAIGITVDYAIHVLYHLDDGPTQDRRRIGQHLGRLVLPISVGALTTAAAFVVMATSPMHGYRQLGIFGAIGVLCSSAFALVILPVLVPNPKESTQPPLWLTGWLDTFFDWRRRRLLWLIAGMVVLSVATGLGLRKLRYEGDVAKLNGITDSTRQDEELIRQTWGDALGMTLVVARGTTLEAALAGNDRAAELLARQPGVSAVYSLAAVCPSLATQEINLRRWQEFWTAERRDKLRTALAQIGTELGFRPEAFTPFWQRVEERPEMLTPDRFRGTPLEQALFERMALGEGDTAVSTLIKVEDHADSVALRRALAGMILIDKRAFADHIAGLAKGGLGYFALWTGVIVAGLLYLSLTSIELVLATLLPVAVGLWWTFGIMGWLNLPIDIMNSVFVIFIIGIGEDYSVFLVTTKLDEWHGRPPRMAATGASVLISALTTIVGFGVLVFARHPVLFSMGTTVLIGMVCTFAATLVLAPLCMDLLLFRDPPRGAPRWWHLWGTLQIALHLGASELLLYYVLRPLLKLTGPARADDRLRRATRCFARGVVKGLPYGRLEFRRITPETFVRPAIVISNHQSAVDVILVVSLPGDIRQTAKQRVFDNPILGIGCKLLGHVRVEPNDPETTLRRCRERLAAGALVHFYPEGTRSPDGFLQRFHRGAFELAVELRQEILPVLLGETATVMPRDSYWMEPGHVVVEALPRVTPGTFDYGLGAKALMRHCEALMRDALQRQLDELNTPATVRRKIRRLYRYQGQFVEQFVHWKLKRDPMFLQLDAIVPRTGFILDLGCGYGLAAHWLLCATDQRQVLGVDYDEDKIRVAGRSAPGHARLRFEVQNILEWDYPPCDAVLLLDVLHYWQPARQAEVLGKARAALRPGGLLILREAARSDGEGHRWVDRWERFAVRIGHNKTEEGLHFRSREELEQELRTAGFSRVELRPAAGRGSNVLLVATAGPS